MTFVGGHIIYNLQSKDPDPTPPLEGGPRLKGLVYSVFNNDSQHQIISLFKQTSITSRLSGEIVIK